MLTFGPMSRGRTPCAAVTSRLTPWHLEFNNALPTERGGRQPDRADLGLVDDAQAQRGIESHHGARAVEAIAALHDGAAAALGRDAVSRDTDVSGHGLGFGVPGYPSRPRCFE
jgi:hypothetical protein